jgi:hypothetical protein
MWNSICDNWEDRAAAIEHIPELHVEMRRQTFDAYWKQKKDALMLNLSDELKEFKEKNDRLGRFTLSEILAKEMQPRAYLSGWQKDWSRADDQLRLDLEPRRIELALEQRRICRENRHKEEFYAIHQKIRDHAQLTERKVAALTSEFVALKKSCERELAFYREYIPWVRSASSELKGIKTVFSQELKRVERLQELEFNELFPPTEVSEADFREQVGPVNLNAAISAALEFHSVKTSPWDCPSSKGYGDFVESTQTEKSGFKDWNLLGIRGLEVVQVSSHRGPPTDRPPDKPLDVSAFAWCLQEFSRSSHCVSGNASSFADSAIWGSRAIEQYCVRAVGSSHGSRAELEACEVWSVQGKLDTCVSCGHPSLNLGRNLFPPRRFSYHTQVSGFNGTARQPSPDSGT